jgi:hypothetical protein
MIPARASATLPSSRLIRLGLALSQRTPNTDTPKARPHACPHTSSCRHSRLTLRESLHIPPRSELIKHTPICVRSRLACTLWSYCMWRRMASFKPYALRRSERFVSSFPITMPTIEDTNAQSHIHFRRSVLILSHKKPSQISPVTRHPRVVRSISRRARSTGFLLCPQGPYALEWHSKNWVSGYSEAVR